MPQNKALNYQEALSEIESIIDEVENGTIGLDELEVKVKRASFLLAYCRKKLHATESEVEKILSDLDPPQEQLEKKEQEPEDAEKPNTNNE